MLNDLKDVIGNLEELKRMGEAKSGAEDKKKIKELKIRIVKELKTVMAQLDKSAQGANKVLKVAMVPIKSIEDANKALRGADKAWLCNAKNQNEIWGKQMVNRSRKISDDIRNSLNLIDEDFKKYYDQILVIAKDISIVAKIMNQGAKEFEKPTATVSPLFDKILHPAAKKLYKSAEKLRKLLIKLSRGRGALSKNDDVLKTFIKETKAEAKKKKKRTNWFAKVEQLAVSVRVVLSKSMVAMKFAEDEFNAADLW